MNTMNRRPIARLALLALAGSAAQPVIADSSALGLRFPFDSANTSGWIQSMNPNDDGSSVLIPLPFAFDFYGASRTSLYINNNGNITFDVPVGIFTPTGFPSAVAPMLAPFWADVDTRNRAGANTNLVWHRFVDLDENGSPDTLVVTWDAVGYYDRKNSRLNTFQVAISGIRNAFGGPDGPGGFNALFSYGSMGWTTGDASDGVNGLGGTPATVGANRGDGVASTQIGRFDRLGTEYNGPVLPSGVEYLNDRDFGIDAGDPTFDPPVISVDAVTPANCGVADGAVSVTVANAMTISWTGPGGFTSSAEDITGVFGGTYTITAEGSGGLTSFSVVVPGEQDTIAPTVVSMTGLYSAAGGVTCTAGAFDFAATVVATDNCVAASQLVVTQNPPAGTALGLGVHPVVVTVRDPAGNSTLRNAIFEVTGTPSSYYQDSDGDGVGSGAPVQACLQPVGFVAEGGDDCPLDPLKLVPGFCGCGAPDADADGNGILDCADVTLTMTAPEVPLSACSSFVVRVSSSSSLYPLTGVQLAMHFDTEVLDFVAVVPVDGTPFTTPIADQHDELAGTIRFAAGIAPGGAPLQEARGLVDLHFTVACGADLCTQTTLVRFAPVGGFVSRFTRPGGILQPILVGLPAANIDTTAPTLIGVPDSIEIATDAGSTVGAMVELAPVTALDECNPSVVVVLEVMLPDGTTSSQLPAGGIFPIGTTTLTWRSADVAGNATVATRTVTVQPFQLLQLNVCFDGVLPASSTRQVRVKAGSSVQVAVVSLSASCGLGSDIPVPVAVGYPCIEAKDPGHSLSGHSPATIVDRHYEASVFLKQGDSNDDDLVDIVDFGFFIQDFGSVVPRDGRSNFNADTIVDHFDLSYISINFFEFGGTCGTGFAPRSPRDRISVQQLRREGLGHLAASDLNLDGWLDLADFQLFIQGGSALQASDGPQSRRRR